MSISNFIRNNYDIRFQGIGVLALEDVSELILLTDANAPDDSSKGPMHFLESAITSLSYKKAHVYFLNQYAREGDAILVEGSPALLPIEQKSPCAWVTKEVSTRAEILGCTTDCQIEFAKFPTMKRMLDFGMECHTAFNQIIAEEPRAIADFTQKLQEQVVLQMGLELEGGRGMQIERGQFIQFLAQELPHQEGLIMKSLEEMSQKGGRTFLLAPARFFNAYMEQMTSFLSLRNVVILSPKMEKVSGVMMSITGVMRSLMKQVADNLDPNGSDADSDEGPSSSTSKRPYSDTSRVLER